jgi:SnoaL-like domain
MPRNSEVLEMTEPLSDHQTISPIERLLAIEEIKQVKAKYFYYLDHKDWAGWKRDVFAPDLVFHVPEARDGPWTDVDSFIAWTAVQAGQQVSVHHGHMPVIEILSPTTAKGIWAMEDTLRHPEGQRSPGGYNFLHGYGHYHETYVRLPVGWRIQTVRLTRLYVEHR